MIAPPRTRGRELRIAMSFINDLWRELGMSDPVAADGKYYYGPLMEWLPRHGAETLGLPSDVRVSSFRTDKERGQVVLWLDSSAWTDLGKLEFFAWNDTGDDGAPMWEVRSVS